MDSIFKAYDIRGLYPDEINEAKAFKIGQAAAKFLKAKTLVIGHDNRVSSPALVEQILKGVTSTGCNVEFLGSATTPLFYFAVNTLKTAGGIMVTASHLASQFNGFKIVGPDSVPLDLDHGLPQIAEALLQESNAGNKESGKISSRDMIVDYVNFLIEVSGVQGVDLGKLIVPIDTGNGMASLILNEITNRINVKVLPLYFEIDNTFPHHIPDPVISENMRDLRAKVTELNADLGIAFDGDGDRLGVIDNLGNVVRPDYIFALLFENLGQPKTLYDLRFSKSVRDLVGGQGTRSRVGHPYIKRLMREKDAVMAGELSGHFFFKEMSYAESAELAMLKLLKIVAEKGKPLSELIKPYQKYFHSGEINIVTRDHDQALKVIERVKEVFKDGKMDELDGLTVEYSNWWFNLRPSNTEPLLRLVVEADDQLQMEQKVTELQEEIKK